MREERGADYESEPTARRLRGQRVRKVWDAFINSLLACAHCVLTTFTKCSLESCQLFLFLLLEVLSHVRINTYIGEYRVVIKTKIHSTRVSTAITFTETLETHF